MAIDEGIAELDKGEGITHENVLHELQAKYP
jgi:predicted transcriptional regulator